MVASEFDLSSVLEETEEDKKHARDEEARELAEQVQRKNEEQRRAEEYQKKRVTLAKRKERDRFLEHALDFADTYRQCYTRVQYMKTRYKDIFEPTDEDNYSLYIRSKRYLSKFEYHKRQMEQADLDKGFAQAQGDVKEFKKKDAESLRYMKDCLFLAFALGQLYTQFRENAGKNA